MNREIKYRAWSKATGKMMNWDFINSVGNLHKLLSLDHIEVMQFTGLKDSDGTDLYEGDIIHSFYSDMKPCRHIIRYSNDQARFVGEYVDYVDAITWTESSGLNQKWIDDNLKTKIGNIYENPEIPNETSKHDHAH